MRALLNPQAATHLVRILGMFGSDQDGEVANAARAADRFIKRLGLAWDDVVSIPAEWQRMIFVCCERQNQLQPHELDFIKNIGRLRAPPTDRQLQWLTDIFERVR